MRIAVAPSREFGVYAIRSDHFDAAVYLDGGLIVVLINDEVDLRPFKSVKNLHLQRRGVHTSGLRCALFGSVEWEEALERLNTIPRVEIFDQEQIYHRHKRNR